MFLLDELMALLLWGLATRKQKPAARCGCWQDWSRISQELASRIFTTNFGTLVVQPLAAWKRVANSHKQKKQTCPSQLTFFWPDLTFLQTILHLLPLFTDRREITGIGMGNDMQKTKAQARCKDEVYDRCLNAWRPTRALHVVISQTTSLRFHLPSRKDYSVC